LSGGDGFQFYFDNDRNGVLYELEDDVLNVTAGLPHFFDNYVVGMPVSSSNQSDTAGAVGHGVRLTVALQRSRQQLVAVREEERGKRRRDLHNGLGRRN
jgi:hypothetical protein